MGGAVTLAWARREGVLGPAVAGLAAQGLITVGLYTTVGLWAPDAVVYDRIGQEFAAHWAGGPVPSVVADGKEAFPLMLGAVHWAVGHASPVGLAMNWAAHGLLVVMCASLARRIGLPVTLTAWVVALFPPSLFWSALLLRESITYLLIAAFLYALVGVARRVNLTDLALLVITLAGLMWFRGTAAIVLAAAGMVALVLTADRRTVVPRLGVSVMALLVLAPRLSGLVDGYTSIADFKEKRTILADADTGFDQLADNPAGSTGDPGAASALLDSVSRVMLGPYPWEWPELGAPLALDGALWLTVLGFTALGLWRAPNRKELLLVVLPALALSAALMITSANYGTMQRLRVQTSVLLIPIAVAGLSIVLATVRARRTGASSRAAGIESSSTDSPR
jgi:hypothetical protein